jgi:hypothetical protein
MIEDQEEEGPGPAIRIGEVLLVGRPCNLGKVCFLIRILDDLLVASLLFTDSLG